MDKAATLLLFGATGDLARRMLLPSLYGLDADGLLPMELRILATARTAMDEGAYRQLVQAALEEHLQEGFYRNEVAERFLGRLHYVAVDATRIEDFPKLAESVGDCKPGLAIFLSTAPSLFKPTIDGLASVGLACPSVRMALEKPLGSDLASSRQINDAVAAAFPEERTFRIDHYLGKETVQNLLALRFANSLFEPLWNASHIDHVQITVAETVGVEGRGDYYDGAGALRDMVQNHMLQLLALVAMEPPTDFDAAAVRDEKVKVLRSLRPVDLNETVIGQYEGYRKDFAHDSKTETFVAIKAHVDNWRWKGVPFYLRTGKKMPERDTEIFIQFKPVPHDVFAERGAASLPNKLIIGLQPEETIRLTLMAKAPGLDRQGMRLREIPLDLGLANAFSEYRRRIAYERLLLDLIEGDPTLFVRRDEIEAQWAWIDAIRAGWGEAGTKPQPYAQGSWGPEAAAALAARDGVTWHS
jgi:glucose-6-phosphate 1-dehydrogenase